MKQILSLIAFVLLFNPQFASANSSARLTAEDMVLQLLNQPQNGVRKDVLRIKADSCQQFSKYCEKQEQARVTNGATFTKKDLLAVISIGSGKFVSPETEEVTLTSRYLVLIPYQGSTLNASHPYVLKAYLDIVTTDTAPSKVSIELYLADEK